MVFIKKNKSLKRLPFVEYNVGVFVLLLVATMGTVAFSTKAECVLCPIVALALYLFKWLGIVCVIIMMIYPFLLVKKDQLKGISVPEHMHWTLVVSCIGCGVIFGAAIQEPVTLPRLTAYLLGTATGIAIPFIYIWRKKRDKWLSRDEIINLIETYE